LTILNVTKNNIGAPVRRTFIVSTFVRLSRGKYAKNIYLFVRRPRFVFTVDRVSGLFSAGVFVYFIRRTGATYARHEYGRLGNARARARHFRPVPNTRAFRACSAFVARLGSVGIMISSFTSGAASGIGRGCMGKWRMRAVANLSGIRLVQ